MKKTVVFRIILAVMLGLLLVACGAGEQDQALVQEQQVAKTAEVAKVSDEPAMSSGQRTTLAPDADDLHPGQRLHDANCVSCHDSSVYSREARKVNDFTQLVAQVKRCDANLGTGLLETELALITKFLNETFYHYPQ